MKYKKLLVFSFLVIINSFIALAQDDVGNITGIAIFIIALVFFTSLFGGGASAAYYKRKREKRFPKDKIRRVNDYSNSLRSSYRLSNTNINETQENINITIDNIGDIIQIIQNDSSKIETVREKIFDLIDISEIDNKIRFIIMHIEAMMHLIEQINKKGENVNINGILQIIQLLNGKIDNIAKIKDEIEHIKTTIQNLAHFQEEIKDLLNKDVPDSNQLIIVLQQFNRNLNIINGPLNQFNPFMSEISIIINQLHERATEGQEQVEESEKINEAYQTLIESAAKFNEKVGSLYRVKKDLSKDEKDKASAIRRMLRVERSLYKLFEGMDAAEIQKNKENLKTVLIYLKRRVSMIKGREDLVFRPDLMRKMLHSNNPHSEAYLLRKLKRMILQRGFTSDLRAAEKEIALLENLSLQDITNILGRQLTHEPIISKLSKDSGFNHVYGHLKTSIENLTELLS